MGFFLNFLSRIFFTLNRLLEIVRSGNEREQLYQFRKMMYDADLEVGLVAERER
jgi:hypothetical protein